MGFREKRARGIDSSILKVLEKNKGKPVSTREIALQIKVSWHSVINHCLRLQLSGKIDGYRIANINVWGVKR